MSKMKIAAFVGVMAAAFVGNVVGAWCMSGAGNLPRPNALEFDGKTSLLIVNDRAPIWAFVMPNGHSVFCRDIRLDKRYRSSVLGIFHDNEQYHVKIPSMTDMPDESTSTSGPCFISDPVQKYGTSGDYLQLGQGNGL